MKHDHTPEEERRIREAALDETLAETFPASDAPSTVPNPDDDSVLDPEKPSGEASSTVRAGAPGRPPS